MSGARRFEITTSREKHGYSTQEETVALGAGRAPARPCLLSHGLSSPPLPGGGPRRLTCAPVRTWAPDEGPGWAQPAGSRAKAGREAGCFCPCTSGCQFCIPGSHCPPIGEDSGSFPAALSLGSGVSWTPGARLPLN